MSKIFFNRSRELESEIKEYLDIVNNSVIIFEKNTSNYIKKRYDLFNESFKEILDIEEKADEYQKDIKYKLYEYMLIPESRADVLELIESIDNIVDLTKKILVELSIEEPDIPEEVEEDFLELTSMSVKTVDVLVKSVRAYFEELPLVNEYINKVDIYEHEVDKIEERIKRKVFRDDIIDEFSRKVHLRYFSDKIALLSDEAEEISERLSVAAIKRKM